MATTNKTRHYTLFAFAIVLVGLNLRPIMAAIGPILGQIQRDTDLTDVAAGLLTTLPVLAMGIFSLSGGKLQRAFGEEKTVLVGIIAIGASSLARFVFVGEVGLILTALIGGIGIAVIQAVLPGLIKRDHSENAGKLMTLYTTGIMGGAMISSALSAPLTQAAGWPFALSFWALFALLAAMSWITVSTNRQSNDGPRGHALPIRSNRAWFLLVFFGIGTAAYTLVLAWLPPFYVGLGWSEEESGLLLGGLTLAQVIAAVGLSSVVDRFTDRRPVFSIVLIVIALGLLCLIFAPKALAIPALLLLGFGIGGLFPMSLIITVDHLQRPSQAGALMGFVQGGGYMIASITPFLGGILRGELNNLALVWIIMLVGIVVQLFMVTRFAPHQTLTSPNWSLQVEP